MTMTDQQALRYQTRIATAGTIMAIEIHIYTDISTVALQRGGCRVGYGP